MDSFYLTMGCYGITMILVQSKLMSNFRDYWAQKSKLMGYLVNCMMCAGFWVGVISSLLFSSIYDEAFFSGQVSTSAQILGVVFDGAYISAAVFIIYLLQLNLEKAVKGDL